MRLCTSRNAEINKNVVLKYANRLQEEKTVSAHGDEYYEYGDIESISLCLMPFKTEIEASAYGVSLLGGRKATITVGESRLFDAFTHIWIETDPDNDKQNSEYTVKNIYGTINGAILVLEKNGGQNVE